VTVDRAVLLIGEFDDVHRANLGHRARALARLGVRTRSFDLNAKPGLVERFRAGDLPKRIERALDEHTPDLVLVVGGTMLDEDLVDRLRGRSRARWATWLPDDLRTITSATQLARPYDQIYAIGTDVSAELAERLGRTVDVLSLAADPSVYRPIRTKDQYRANVVFAGAATPRRERLLAELVEFGLAVWGPGWRKTSLRDYCRGEVPGTEQYVRAYAGASVAINIHHVAVEGDPLEASCNLRLFELASMGLAQVVDERGDLARHFEPGREVATFRDGRELKDTVRHLLENPVDGERLGAGARARLLHDHTWMHRMRQLLLDQPAPLSRNEK
jgi:spore maturation protein CgeB